MAFFAMLVLFAPAAQAQDAPAPEDLLITRKLPRGTEIHAIVSRQANTAPKTAVLLFAGYPGVLRIRMEGASPAWDLKGNFLVRARRHLLSPELMTVLVDCPVDTWKTCDDRYRSSPEHVADVSELIAALREQYGVTQVYLAGTSYGTVSSAHLALALGQRINGAIHTATFTDPDTRGRAQGLSMWKFDWSAIRTDQLFVHHRSDPCGKTRYDTIAAARGNLPLITVQGTKGSRGDPCEAFSAHGFVGRERAVMKSIAQWVANRSVAATVGEDVVED